MMNLPSHRGLRALMEQRNAPCISLFLPAARAGMETQQNPLRLRHQIRAAEHRLHLKNLRARQVEALLESLQALLEAELF
jgi:hypothetical protein